MSHHSLSQKRSAVEIYRVTKKLKKEHGAKWLNPMELASISAAGASKTQIYEWLKQDLSQEDSEGAVELRGNDKMLHEDQTHLLVGFVISERFFHRAVSLYYEGFLRCSP